MPTNQHNNFIELYRLYKEMVDEDDFIQQLERLRSGSPGEAKDSVSSSPAAGINRPLARLAHNTDAVLEALQTTRTGILASDNVVLNWSGTGLTFGAGTISFRFGVTGFAGNDTGNDGVFEFSTTSSSTNNIGIANGQLMYLSVDRSLTSSQDLISNLTVSTFETFVENLQDVDKRLKYIPIAYNASNCLNFFFNNISLPEGTSYDFNTGVVSFYATKQATAKMANARLYSVSTQYCQWNDSTSVLTIPSNLKISTITAELNITGANVTLSSDGDIAYLKIPSGTILTASIGNFGLDNDTFQDGIIVLAVRLQQTIILYNGVSFGVSGSKSFIPFSSALEDVQGFNKLHARDTSSTDYRMLIQSTSNPSLTADRTLTVDMNNADRSLSLEGSLSIGSGGLTTGSSSVVFDADSLTIGSYGAWTAAAGTFTMGAGDVSFSSGDVSFTNTGNISFNQGLGTTDDVTFNSVTTTQEVDVGDNLLVGGYADFDSYLKVNGDITLDAGSSRTIEIDAASSGTGNFLVVKAGNGTGGNSNGGSLVLKGGNTSGNGVSRIGFYTASSTETTTNQKVAITPSGYLVVSDNISGGDPSETGVLVVQNQDNEDLVVAQTGYTDEYTKLAINSSGVSYIKAGKDLYIQTETSGRDATLKATQHTNIQAGSNLYASAKEGASSGDGIGYFYLESDVVQISPTSSEGLGEQYYDYVNGETADVASEASIEIRNNNQDKILTIMKSTPSLYMSPNLDGNP